MIIIKMLILNIMIVTMKDVKDLIVELSNCSFTIKYPDVDYRLWKSFIPYDGDVDIMYILNEIFTRLDVSVEWGGKRLISTTNMTYNHDISLCYYYMLHIEDQDLYNNSFEALCDIHTNNIQFELDNPIVEEPVKQPKSKSRDFAKMKARPKGFVKQVTKDMFSDKEVYIYSNSKTGEIIQSDNPDLLEELNAPKKKVKETKVVGVPMAAMQFTLKKKT